MIVPPQPPQPPRPPQLFQEKEEDIGPTSNNAILDELGLPQEYFAEVALSSSVDWNGEQLDALQNLLEGEPADEETVLELFDQLTQRSEHKPKDAIHERPSTETIEEPYEASPLGLSNIQLPLLEVPTGRVNLDDWLKKK